MEIPKMAILAKGSSGSDFKPVPEGTHVARCVTVVDCGQQKVTWNGEEKWQHKVWIAFEVPAVRVSWTDREDKEHEGPALIGAMYTNSIGERAKLGQHLSSWRGKSFTSKEIADGFDVSVLLDKPCQIAVTHNESQNGKTYANITSIMGIPQGMEAPARETDLTLYDPGTSEAKSVFDGLPKWLQEKVTFGHRLDTDQPNTAVTFGPMETPNVPGTDAPAETAQEFDDDIPF
jgi:hypothetical protein